MDLDGLRQWKCPNGHVLGVIQRIEINDVGHKGWVTRLMLFRHAIDLQSGQMADVDVAAAVEGTTLDVRCDVQGCGKTRSWFIGEEAINHLMRRVLKRQEVAA
jgi:hypothetical protein